MPDLYQNLQGIAYELGFSTIGIIPAAPARRLQAYLNWVATGMQGTMQYLARQDRIERRQDPRLILPDMQSIVCVGLDYATIKIPEKIKGDPGRGRISNYAWGVDYHDLMIPRLEKLAAFLKNHDPQAKSRVYVDTGAVLERDHAESAGLGFTGKNTMLIAPKRGSWLFLGEILTTIPLAEEKPFFPMPGCGSCQRCLDACPTGAFPKPYVLDARRCISYLTIELKGWIPRELRSGLGNWVYGCDICQEVCPFNRFAQPAREPAFYPVDWDMAAPLLVDLLALEEEAFEQRFERSPIKRIKRHRLVRNACVAAGNWGNQTAVSFLTALLADEEPLIRGHAAWALHQIGGETAQNALSAALNIENHEDVRRELAGAS